MSKKNRKAKKTTKKKHTTTNNNANPPFLLPSTTGFNNYEYNNNKVLENDNFSFNFALDRVYNNYEYDANGNMTKTTKYSLPLMQPSFPAILSSRNLYWNDSDQLQAVQDTNYSSYYFYDYAGERTWKTSGAKITTTTNGTTIKYNIFNNSTLYVFPELTVTSQSYIKHVFAESERICSKIGKGTPCGNSSNISVINVSPNNISTKKTAQKKLMRKVYTNLCIPTSQQRCAIGNNCNVMSTNILKPTIDSMTNHGGIENARYFYHGDHLGSSSWITDKDGNALQYISYLPYGQLFMDLKTTSYDASYKFIGKERDSETGFDYFGARYYSNTWAIWLSVDPMADQRSWVSPYSYCQNNPVGRVDATGALDVENLDWYKTKSGEIKYDASIHEAGDLIKKGISGNYLGKTYKEGGKYYSLFGQVKSSGTMEGKLYEKIDQTFTNYANYILEYDPYAWEAPIEHSADFNIGVPYQKNSFGFGDYNVHTFNYEGATGYYFVYGDPAAMKGKLDWGSNVYQNNKNYGFGNMKPGYNTHIYVSKSPKMDIVTLVFPTLESRSALRQKFKNEFQLNK